MNILCGTDFSPNAGDAVNASAALARRFGDVLVLVHAHVPPVDDGVDPEVWTAMEGALRQQLEAQAAPLRDAGHAVRALLEPGSPVEVMDRLAAAPDSRMLVLSSIGRVALARVVLGSTADRVAESAQIPTLVVRRGLVFTEWAQGKRPLRLFAAADFSDASDAALACLRTWADAGPVDLLIGHVQEPEAPAPDRGSRRGRNTSARKAPAGIERDLKERIRGVLGKVPFTLKVINGEPTGPSALIELAKHHRADVVFTGTSQTRGLRRLWHRSVSRSLLSDSPTNVVVVPAPPGGVPVRIPPMDRVLAATDLSPLGNRAVAAACALLPRGGHLHVLHVVPPPPAEFSLVGGNPGSPTLSPGEREARNRHLESVLAGLVPPGAAPRGLHLTASVVESDSIPKAVIAEVRRTGAHAVCLGSHGRSAVLSLLLGSVARDVVAQSPVPVHLVPPPRT